MNEIIASLREELSETLIALNRLHHPVYPADPRRVNELEKRVEELRAAIAAERAAERAQVRAESKTANA